MNNKQLINQFKLPAYVSGKSFADASKEISKRFEGRNDMISNNTKNELLKRLADAQEYSKSQEQQVQQEQMAMGGYTNKFEDGGWYDQNNPYLMNNPGVQQPVIGPINQIQPTNQLSQANSLSQIKPFSTDNQLPTASAIPDTAGTISGGLKEMSGKTGLGLSSALGAASTAVDLGKTAFGKPAQDTSGLAASAKVDTGGMIGGNALKGAQAGMAFGPLGAGIGAIVGAGAGLLGAKKAQKAALENTNNFAINTNRKLSDNYFALGGEIDPPIVQKPFENKETWNTKPIVKYQPGVTHGVNGEQGFYIYSKDPSKGNFNPETDREFIRQENMMDLQRTPQWKTYLDSQNKNNIFAKGGRPEIKGLESYLNPTGLKPLQGATLPTNIDLNIQQPVTVDVPLGYKIKEGLKTAGKAISDNSDLLRYAPAVANAIQLRNLKKPQGVRLDRMDNRYRPDYVDLAQQQNIVNQELNNVNSAIQQSGASQGQSRAAILGAQLNKTRALSNAYMNAQAQNVQQNATAQEFNLGVDRVNLQQANNQQDINDRNMGAYDTQKSNLISQIGNDLGAIGKEQLFKQYPKMMGLGYNWNGKYFINDKGDIKTTEDAEKLENNKAKGGFLNSDVLSHINNMYSKRNSK